MSAVQDVSSFPIGRIIALSLKEFTYTSTKISNVIVVEKTSTTDDVTRYLLSQRHRDQCWIILDRSWIDGALKRSGPALCEPKKDQRSEHVGDAQFLNILRDLPAKIIDESVEEWLVADGELILKWEF